MVVTDRLVCHANEGTSPPPSVERSSSMATSSSVDHVPCGSISISKVRPPSSTMQSASRRSSSIATKVSRTYSSVSIWSDEPRREYEPFFSRASLTSKRSAKSQSASMRTTSSSGTASWLRMVSSSWKPLPTVRWRITDTLESM